MNAIKIQPVPSRFFMKDIDGNIYPVIRIGKYLVTLENLRTTRYNNGEKIIDTCFPGNNPDNAKEYGLLYNFKAVRGKLTPTGWFVPSDEEWQYIESAFGMTKEEAERVGWRGNEKVTQKLIDVLKIKFAGYDGGHFGSGTYLWSSTPNGSNAWGRYMYNGNTTVLRHYWYQSSYRFSVRCLRELTPEEIDLLDNEEDNKRDCKGKFISTKNNTEMKQEISFKEKLCIKLILLALTLLKPCGCDEKQIEEIRKLL